MALTIENSTIGFDANNVEKALNNLNTEVIQATISQLNRSMSDLRSTVDEGWVGASAEKFKENLEKDKETVSESLNKTYDTLKKEMYDIVNKMGEADEELVKGRGE